MPKAQKNTAAPVEQVPTSDEVAQPEALAQDASAEHLPATEPQAEDPPPAQTDAAKVKARVLADCALGKCNDVVEVDAKLAETMQNVLDTDPAAVEYAESLKKD